MNDDLREMIGQIAANFLVGGATLGLLMAAGADVRDKDHGFSIFIIILAMSLGQIVRWGWKR